MLPLGGGVGAVGVAVKMRCRGSWRCRSVRGVLRR